MAYMEINYLLDKEFPFGLEKFLLDDKKIESQGLKIIGQIETKFIDYGSDKLKKFLNDIDSTCKNRRLWILFGKNNSANWLPLQLASVCAENKDIRSEIKTDFKRMIPFNSEKDVRAWTSEFHGVIMQVEIGRDVVCQKYSKLREKCSHLAIAILEKEEYSNKDNEIISMYQKREIELAYELKPLIWNPSPIEKKYIKEKKNSSLCK